MHVLAFFGVLAIVLVRIAHPPADPVQPQVMSAAQLAPEQRQRAADAAGNGRADRPRHRTGDGREEIR